MLIFDRRHYTEAKQYVALVGFIVLWFAMSSWATTEPMLDEHGKDIAQLEWYVILGLVGTVQALISYIYISGIKSLKEGNRELFKQISELRKEKLDKEDCGKVCRP